MKRLSQNLLSLVATDVLRRFFGFLAVAYLARTLGVESFGIVSIALTVLSYAIMAGSSGLHILGTREIARDRDAPIVGEIVGARLINTGAVLLVLTIVSVVFVRDRSLALLIVITGGAAIPQALLLEWYCQGREEMAVTGVARTVSSAVYVVVIVLLVHSGQDIVFAAVAAVIGDTAAYLILQSRYRVRVGRLHIVWSLKRWRSLMQRAIPLGGGSLFGHLSINFPPIALALFSSTTQVGLYSAAGRMVFFLLMLDRVVAPVLLPASVRLQTTSRETLGSTLGLALKWILVIALPVSAGGTLLADDLVVWVFGGAYSGAVAVFRVLVWYFLFTVLHTIYTSGLLAVGGERSYGKIMGASLLCYLVTVGGLGFAYGSIGAASGVLLSEAITVVLMRNALYKKLDRVTLTAFGWIVTSTIGMVAVLLLIPRRHFSLLILVGALVYGVLLFLTRAIKREDVALLTRRFV